MPKFIRPNEKARLEAIGLIKSDSNPVDYQWKVKVNNVTQSFPPIKYFIPDGFCLIPKPKSGDWLAEHKEPGQSFARFSTGPRSHPLPRKDVIYIQPLEFYTGQAIPENILNTLCKYAGIFFGLPVKKMKPIRDLLGDGALKLVKRRVNEHTSQTQVNASDIMSVLKGLKPTDAFCISGITLCDIYPRDEWNFVFGLASTEDGTGVYSLSRYLPETMERPMLLRAVRVMCHEICHMFGIKHCIYFSCLLNGSNHAEEAINRPTFLCPSCLRKLHFMVNFDIGERYENMLLFWENISQEGSAFNEDIEWLKIRISL